MEKSSNQKHKKTFKQSYSNVRHTHNTIAGIEDLTAVHIDLLYCGKHITELLTSLTAEVTRLNTRIEKAIQILHILRQGPYSYPVDDEIVAIKIKRNSVQHDITYQDENEDDL